MDEAGVDPERLGELMEFARAHESKVEWCDDYSSRKAEKLANLFGPHADVEMVGPFTKPGGLNCVVIRHGYLVAELGDTTHVDEIASATKSFLSALVGVAFDKGLIRDVNRSVYEDTKLPLLDSQHSRGITWRHLLQQTSEWEGKLFGKHTSGHDGRRVGEALREPGAYFEYNDVRVNLLARCLLEVFRRPLPEVLREAIMNPMGASSDWEWHGYATSRVEIDGQTVESVSGGSHWGGGIWMNSLDLARFGLLYLRKGSWGSQRVLSSEWIGRTRTSCPMNYMYGYLWWLQHDERGHQVSFAAQGGGSHNCFVIPEHDMVIVVRWIQDRAWMPFLERALRLVKDRPGLGKLQFDFDRINRTRA